MKAASGAMITLLENSDQLYFADLITITRQNGTVVQRFTTAQLPVTFGGNVFQSSKPQVDRQRLKWSAGLDVDKLVLLMKAIASDSTVMGDLIAGLYDDALVQLDRVYSATWGDWSAGSVPLFKGNVADIADSGRTSAKVTVASRLQILNQPTPRTVYQAACRWTLFDAGCTLIKNSFGVNGTVSSGNTLVFNTNLSQADGYFDLGTLTFLTGANAGVSASIRSYLNTSGKITLYRILQNAVANGDTFTAFPGCDKTMGTCTSKFNNLQNFGGQPFVPVPETAL